jgi:Tol biopolymer transport system component
LNSDRTGNMNIWIYSFAEKKTQQVTNGPGGDFQPNWSPDGKRIAFFSSRSGNPEIWIVDSNGNDLKQLTESRSVDINPFFHPDGKQIAYQSDRSGRLEVWMMNADGTDPYQITNFGVMGHFLRWSADGDFLFCRCSSGKQPLMKVPIQGGEPSPLKEIAGGSHISFSPDQSLIMDVVGHKQLWLSSLKKGKPKMVFEFAESEARIDYPAWSPDGKWILFDKFQPQGGDIWLMKGF